MIKLDSTNKLYPLLAMLTGAILFTVSNILFSVLVENYFLGGFLLPSVISTLLMGLILRVPLKKIGVMAAVISLAYPILFLLAFAFGYLGGELLGESGGNIITAIVLAGESLILGVLLGRVIYGEKFISIFAVVFGIVSIIVLILTLSDTYTHWLTNLVSIFGQWQHFYPEEGLIKYDKVNSNFLLIFTGIGTALGLSIGLYNRKLKVQNNY